MASEEFSIRNQIFRGRNHNPYIFKISCFNKVFIMRTNKQPYINIAVKIDIRNFLRNEGIAEVGYRHNKLVSFSFQLNHIRTFYFKLFLLDIGVSCGSVLK